MRTISEKLRLAATDVSNHLACRHLTYLELGAAQGRWEKPDWAAPDLVVIRELGEKHEADYLRFLQGDGVSFVSLAEVQGDDRALAQTLAAMEKGVEIIAQGSLQSGDWFGRADVLRRVERHSNFGPWSYEAYDCKLARETKATTILQLAFYSELLERMQGAEPEFMHVVPPGRNFEAEKYRVAEYAAYYRYVKEKLQAAIGDGAKLKTYPEPCAHCEVCRWFPECDGVRRKDDHLSLVAGIGKLQRKQLEEWTVETVERLAQMPVPLKQKPLHGSREGMERVREQARVQVQGRTQKKLVHELLDVEVGMGFCRLPEPSPGDLFVDLEGDAFVGACGHQYLFGLVAADESGKLRYDKRWAFTAEEEKRGFEWVVEEVMQRWKKFPAMHVYHFGAYEPSTFKRLMGTYATKEEEIDSMLRAGTFVDLHTVCKQAVRASVEEYGLKPLEAFYAFERKTRPEKSKAAMRYVEHRLELGWNDRELPQEFRDAMEGYNGEDCLSTAAMRDWLEGEREKKLKTGVDIPRPPLGDAAPNEEVDQRQKRVKALVERLTSEMPADANQRSSEQSAAWMLAQLLDWHRRENKATWWEYYRLRDLDDNDLMEERAGLAGLQFVERLGVERNIPTDRYRFEKQETEVRCDKDVYRRGDRFGCVVAVDLATMTIDVKKTKKTAELHPTAVYTWDRPVNVGAHEQSLMRLAEWVSGNGIDAVGELRAVRDLLLCKPPRLSGGETLAPLPLEETKVTACRIARAMEQSVFAIQGPPGAGKTYTGARMICELVKQGKRVGVTALSHKVIRKLLEEVVTAAGEEGAPGARCMQKLNKAEDFEFAEQIAVVTENEEALDALRSGRANVLGGTSWLWADVEAAEAVDALFVDEAGQMALAEVAAVGQAARNLVLIGDPQQLERPVKGSHPDGAEKSALEHMIGEHKTIAPTMGMLLPETWRMHPEVCAYTSEMFYEGRLQSREGLKNRVLANHPWLRGAGLWFVPIEHAGNRNSSAEEVRAVASIVDSLVGRNVKWFRGIERSRDVELDDVVIVAPYNAQVSDLLVKLPPGARIGTVDKFQGQEAPVVIYSLTTSSPEDAPRGMEFLYSLNRFNVATSRAMTAVIVVGSPRLFEPECKSPRQMQLANAFCAYLERATRIEVEK